MARAIWTGMLTFGLVNLPVGLYSATQQKDVHFRQFEEGTNQRIRYKRVAEGTDREVPYEKIVKGYELDSGEYVMLTQEELESVEPGKSRTIEISDFVELAEIDPIYFEKSYYLAPQADGSERAYALLRRAMEESGLVGVASFVMRSKQYLATIRPQKSVLVLETMFFPDEVRDPLKELESLRNVPEDVSERELEAAVTLIEQLAIPWEPKRYHDAYRERVLEMIESKAKGERVEVAAEAPEETKVVDLMDALRRSVEAAQASRAGKGQKPAGKGKKRAAPKDLSRLSKDELLERARELELPGRSKMKRAELEEAIRRAS